MTRFLAPLALSLMALAPSIASATPVFLPELTFPAPVQQPDVSTQGCVAPAHDVCQYPAQ